MKRLTILFFTFLAFSIHAKNVAVVKLFRGTAKVISNDKGEKKIFKGMWINEGDVVKTSEKSFVRLSFIDKSTVNVGPTSELKVEKFSKNEAGVLDVIQGRIRAKVTKDYLDMDKDKSKLFVKSKAAVMGIRGTDFIYSVGNDGNNGATAILFEGSVVFNKRDINDGPDLEKIVNRGRRIKPGNFSVVSKDLVKPTIPVKLNSKQRRALEKDVNFSNETLSNKSHKKGSKVPAGISAEIVSSSESSIKESIVKDLSLDIKVEKKLLDIEASKFQSNEDGVRPAAGSIIVLEANTILPIGKNAVFDENSQEWRSSDFHVGENGEVIPPEGIKIQNDGSLVKMEGEKQVIINIDVNNMNEPNILAGEKPKQAQDSPSGVNGQESSANGDDWYQPPSQTSTPTHLQNQQGSGGPGTTNTRFTFSKEP